MTINVHSYESMGTFDGPGLRLVVFLQGCNFRCLYCANPDTIAGKGGTPTPPEEIVRMAMSQRPFFGKRGGVTFSGGEPTFQAKALIPLVRELKEKGIHVCIDSNGGIWNEEVEELFRLTDLVLLDVKEFNPDGEKQRANDPHSSMAGREWKTVLAALRISARLQRFRRGYPPTGRSHGNIQNDSTRGSASLPYIRRTQVRSYGTRIQTERRKRKYPRTT